MVGSERLIATLGTSPGGIYETYKNLTNANYDAVTKKNHNIDEIILITTNDPNVNFAYKLVELIFAYFKESVSIKRVSINFSDIDDYKKSLEFLNIIKTIDINEKDLIDITGGRKSMSTILAIEASRKNAKIFTTIIPQNMYHKISGTISSLKNYDIESALNELKKDYNEALKRYEWIKLVENLISKDARTFRIYL